MRILIIEDEVDLASGLRRALEGCGFACDLASDGRGGLYQAQSVDYDALILDLMLPGLDGRALLRQLRERKPTPVLVLTARDALRDKVDLLDTGADDYLTKPFAIEELLARLRSLIRRAARRPRPKLEVGPVVIDTVARMVTREGVPVALTPKEYALVEYLALHRGEVVTHSRIYEHLYDDREDTLSNVVDVYISNVRRKLGRDFVRTRRGEGYVVDA
jgi:two-component system OmpR family response regulator